MKYVDEYHEAALAGHGVAEISRLSADQPLTLMQIGSRHIHTLYKYGIQDLLPRNITMGHGPGYPACVLPRGRIDDALSVACTDGVIFTAFADTLRVPGSQSSLVEVRAEGADVCSVSSPLDALKLAQQHPQRQVVFFAVGFETIAAATAATLLQARAEGVKNFSIFCNHVTLLPALKALLEKPAQHLDGLVIPGHVSMVTGLHPYDVLAHQYHKPVLRPLRAKAVEVPCLPTPLPTGPPEAGLLALRGVGIDFWADALQLWECRSCAADIAPHLRVGMHPRMLPAGAAPHLPTRRRTVGGHTRGGDVLGRGRTPERRSRDPVGLRRHRHTRASAATAAFSSYVDTCTKEGHILRLRRTYVLCQKEQVHHASPPCPQGK